MKTIKIKDRKDRVLFTHTCESNSIKITLEKAVSERADLSYAYLKGANLRYADLRSVNLTYADLRYADLTGADLTNADLEAVILIGACLRGTNLEGANLREANLRDAWLMHSDLTDANLKESWLRNTDLTGAITNKPLKKDTEDKVVTKVINSFRERSEQGINKYGTTLQRDDLSPLEWMQHLQEELMDATLYIEVLKSKLIKLEIKEAEDKVSEVCD
jgi:uncharacterized protein YjbI with pentapeptide repeats